jgi:hypothetical protein
VLDVVTVADVVGGTLPTAVRAMLDDADAWDAVAAVGDISH